MTFGHTDRHTPCMAYAIAIFCDATHSLFSPPPSILILMHNSFSIDFIIAIILQFVITISTQTITKPYLYSRLLSS